MDTNALPPYDASDNPTGCCPRFHPEGWDGQTLHFRDKLFLRATTRSLFHIPLNMGTVYPRAMAAIQAADAFVSDGHVVLSRDPTPWRGEHLFAIRQPVPGYESVKLSGDFLTQVFEGPSRDTPKWQARLRAVAEREGRPLKDSYFFYTTCPRCAAVYGKNYVVGFAGV